MMALVNQILTSKGSDVWSVAPQATVYEALQIMAEKDIGALMVMDADRLIGVFSERDYARKLILKGRFSKETQVKELMTTEVVFIEPRNTVEECMALMTVRHIRHLPVLEDGQVIGIVTIGDLVKEIISDQEFTIQQLEKYITTGY